MADDEYDLWDTLHLQPGATLDEVQHRHTVEEILQQFLDGPMKPWKNPSFTVFDS